MSKPITVEYALFLTQCLQANEPDRMNLDTLLTHVFLNLESPLHDIDIDAYRKELKAMTELIKMTGNEEQMKYLNADSPRSMR